jgi:hypothetical protein
MAKVEIGVTTQGAQRQLNALYGSIASVSKQLDALITSAATIRNKLGGAFQGAKVGDSVRTSLQGAQKELENFSLAIDRTMQNTAAKISSRIQGAFSGFGLNATQYSVRSLPRSPRTLRAPTARRRSTHVRNYSYYSKAS